MKWWHQKRNIFPVGVQSLIWAIWQDLIKFQIHINRLIFSNPQVPNLRDLMPDDLRWSWCNNNRNKVHNKYHVLESSWNHPSLQPMEELSSEKLVPGAKMLGTATVKCLEELLLMLVSPTFRRKFHIICCSNQVIRALKFHFLPQGKQEMMR